MNTGIISVRYATALLDFAKEKNSVAKVYSDAKMLTLMFSKMSELRLVLENPVIPVDEKKQLIFNTAGGAPSDIFKNFIALLLQNKRENQVQEIMLKFIDLYREQKNIRYGKLTTAFAVDEATENKLLRLVTNKVGGTLELEKAVDPDILGGFVLVVDDVRWDASLSGQLRQIKNEYIERNRRIV